MSRRKKTMTTDKVLEKAQDNIVTDVASSVVADKAQDKVVDMPLVKLDKKVEAAKSVKKAEPVKVEEVEKVELNPYVAQAIDSKSKVETSGIRAKAEKCLSRVSGSGRKVAPLRTR